jgi:hypothetical protein
MNALGPDAVGYFNSTAAYAVAYAVAIGVEQITLFGFDFTYPNAHQAEQGRGLRRVLPRHGQGPRDPHRPAALHQPDGRLHARGAASTATTAWTSPPTTTTPARWPSASRRELPTAEEIEARYDHSNTPTRSSRPRPPPGRSLTPMFCKVLKAFPYAHDHHVVSPGRGRRRRHRRRRGRGPGRGGLHRRGLRGGDRRRPAEGEVVVVSPRRWRSRTTGRRCTGSRCASWPRSLAGGQPVANKAAAVAAIEAELAKRAAG